MVFCGEMLCIYCMKLKMPKKKHYSSFQTSTLALLADIWPWPSVEQFNSKCQDVFWTPLFDVFQVISHLLQSTGQTQNMLECQCICSIPSGKSLDSPEWNVECNWTACLHVKFFLGWVVWSHSLWTWIISVV